MASEDEEKRAAKQLLDLIQTWEHDEAVSMVALEMATVASLLVLLGKRIDDSDRACRLLNIYFQGIEEMFWQIRNDKLEQDKPKLRLVR